jgi:sortase A
MPARLTSFHRSPLLWIERLLLLVGVICLGIVGYAWLDARSFQAEQNRRLDAALAARQAAAPAAETDSFESFRRQGHEEPPRSAAAAAPGLAEGDLLGRIEIPRVGISAVILEGVESRTLRRGVGHIPNTALPAQGGNVGIAGHRDSFFRGLKGVRKNDAIELTTLDGVHRYRVDWTRVVRPEDSQVLADSGAPSLTLVTCYPFYYVGSAPNRFIVHASRLDERGPSRVAAGGGS